MISLEKALSDLADNNYLDGEAEQIYLELCEADWELEHTRKIVEFFEPEIEVDPTVTKRKPKKITLEEMGWTMYYLGYAMGRLSAARERKNDV